MRKQSPRDVRALAHMGKLFPDAESSAIDFHSPIFPAEVPPKTSDWIEFRHTPTVEPITVVEGMEYANWPSPGKKSEAGVISQNTPGHCG